MSVQRTIPAGLIAVGVQNGSLINSTALGLNTTATGTSSQGKVQAIHLAVESSTAIRFRSDGSDATLTTGVLITSGLHLLEGLDFSSFSMQRSTGSASFSLQSYSIPGQK